jgi:hypothetical protein
MNNMCLIVDTNLASQVFGPQPQPDFTPIIDWLTLPTRNGILAVGGQLRNELDNISCARRFIKTLNQAGRARIFPDQAIEDAAGLIAKACISDDAHVIALARISGARILCSHDTDLHEDFTNPAIINSPRGRVYQKKSHAHLLRKFGHTTACRPNI